MKKDIFIVLTQTGSIVSAGIKLAKKKEYNHASLAMDVSLEPMYSFGRRHPYNPFWGGFVEEHIHSGTFKRFPKTRCSVYRAAVEESQYAAIEELLARMLLEKERYKFNVRGLMTAAFDKYKKRENYYYCSEFVRRVLEEAGVDVSAVPEAVHPEYLTALSDEKPIYTGLLREYR